MRAGRFLAVVALVVAGCASRAPSFNLAFESTSATLYVEGAEGAPVSPLGGLGLTIDDGVRVGPHAIGLVPGRHHLGGVHCPPPDEIAVDGNGALSYVVPSHGWPLTHDFEVGKSYLLRCDDGYPEIVPYEPSR
jgi:hypothetical protein